MDEKWLSHFLSFDEMEPNRTGHAMIPAGPPAWGGRDAPAQVAEKYRQELGLGWIYYGLMRALAPQNVLCIGSGRGFVPVVLAKAQCDQNAPAITFVDPSFDDGFWEDSELVDKWFSIFGVEDHICHHLMTTEQFAASPAGIALPEVDLLFIDGCHFYEAVKTDFQLMSSKLAPGALVLFHDTISRSANPKWSGPRQLLIEIEEDFPQWQMLDFPFGAGLTLMRERAQESMPSYFDRLGELWPHKESTEF